MTRSSDRPLDHAHWRNRLRQHATRSRAAPPADPAAPAAPPLQDRVAWVLIEAGFPSLLIENGQVVLSGFVVTVERDGDVRIHWTGSRDVNALPYRRTFLGAYASTLSLAGLDVAYVEREGEPYLRCGAGLTPPGPPPSP